MRLHARRLPCENNSAILRRCCEVGPGHGGCVADYLRSFDKILECLRRLEAGQGREAVGGDQVHMCELQEGKLGAIRELLRTHQVVWDLRTRIGHIKSRIHAIHCE